MTKSVVRFRVYEARRTTHPVWNEIEKYTFTVAAKDLPQRISWAANAREPVGLNRQVYKDVLSSLKGEGAVVGTFDLMNKGITILAESVKLVNKEKGVYDVTIDDDLGGIVDGAHTAQLIWQAQDADKIPDGQHVDVYVRTGIDRDLFSDIAKGLNTAIQVKKQSIYDIDGVFDWLKEEIGSEPYRGNIAYSESDDADYDVRDLIGVLEVFNIFDFPNGAGLHPISAYEKWSVPLEKFGKDFANNKDDLSKSTYHRLKPLLKGGLKLYDVIRHDFQHVHNDAGGKAGNLKIVEKAGKTVGNFAFAFAADLSQEEYRLTKGAAYPILAAFRNYVEMDEDGNACWRGGFSNVLRAWREIGPLLVADTIQETQDGKRYPDQLGKSRGHWADQHRIVQGHVQEQEVRVLREKLAVAEAAVSSKSGRIMARR
jgi:hypothetical protein